MGERWPLHSHIFDAEDCTFLHGIFLSENDVLILIHKLATCSSQYKALNGSYMNNKKLSGKSTMF